MKLFLFLFALYLPVQAAVDVSFSSQGFNGPVGKVSGVREKDALKARKKIAEIFLQLDRKLLRNVSVLIVGKIEDAEAYADGTQIVISHNRIESALVHELIHVLDHQYASAEELNYWSRYFNPENFQYMGPDTTEREAKKIWPSYQCYFASPYGMLTVGEDRAELGALILTRPQEIQTFLTRCPELSQKSQAMREFFEKIR